MTAQLASTPVFKAFDNNGAPLFNGKLFSYIAGTTTKQATYTDSTQGTQNTNPIILNARGEAAVWLDATKSYKLVLSPSTDTDPPTNPIWSVDTITGSLNPNGSIIPTVDNSFTLGSATVSWANIYLGAGHAPAFDPVSGTIGYYKQTAAEIAAAVTPTNYSYQPFDIRRYGADPTAGTASDAALTSAIAVCGTTGGTIHAPGGTYNFASQINLNVKTSIIIQGDGATTGGAGAGTRFQFTGTGTGVWITMLSAKGVQFRGVQLAHTNAAFTGTYITCNNDGTHGDPSFCGLFDCNIGNSISAAMHLDLNKCINFTAERCLFSSGSPSVRGAQVGGYSNVVRFRDCEWYASLIAPIQDLGQAWNFEGCTFEALSTGAPGALLTSPFTTFGIGLVVKGCWFGDATATVGTWINGYYTGAVFEGNYFSGNQTGSTCFDLSAPNGVVIKGNSFGSFLVGINFSSGGGGGQGNDISNNIINNVTTWITNSVNTNAVMVFNPNSPLQGSPNAKQGVFAQNGMEISPNGIIRQWGFASNKSFGNNTITFPVAFTTACWNVRCTLSGVVAGTATIYATNLTTTNFIASITDGTSTTDSFFWEAIGN